MDDKQPAATREGSTSSGEKREKASSPLPSSSSGSDPSDEVRGPEGAKMSMPFFGHPNIPKPPLSMDDRPLMPDLYANVFSRITFWWIQPMLLLGNRRPIEKEDLWKIDVDERGAKVLADRFTASFERRHRAAEEWNRRLDSGEYKPSRLRRNWWWLKSKTTNLGYPDGRRRAGLAGSISEVMFWRFWTGGFLKVLSDLFVVFTPLVTRYLITYSTAAYYSSRGVAGYTMPTIANGWGAAVGLLLMLIASSLLLHNFFYRSASTGVLTRGMLIHAIYKRSLRMTGKARAQIPSSRIINHISTDVSRIDFTLGFFHMAWTGPIQFIVITILLIIELGPTSLIGVAVLVLTMPVQSWFMKGIFSSRKKAMVFSDQRAKLTQELLSNVKTIKLFAWEVPFVAKLNGIRRKELALIRRLLIIKAVNMSIAMAIPVIATIVAFAAYILTGNGNSPASIFTSLTLFNLLRVPLMVLPMSLGSIADSMNALNRLRELFVCETLDDFLVIEGDQKNAIEIKNASFAWESSPPDAAAKPKGRAAKQAAKKAEATAKSGDRRRMFRKKQAVPTPQLDQPANTETITDQPGPLAVVPGDDEKKAAEKPEVAEYLTLRDVNLSIPTGALVAVCGPVGSGKSSFLQGLIGEMKRTDGAVTFNGSIGYAAQIPWIQNASLRENILFGQPFDEAHYKQVIHDSCLEADIAMLPSGDGTQIGEKGITLSGGQRQRVNIARMLYYRADIALLDDPLSAVDAHVGKHLFEHAICGALKDKTRILATHALHFLKASQIDYIICLDHGQIAERGTYAELIARNGAFAKLMAEHGGGDAEAQAEKEEDAIEDVKAKAPEEKKPVDEKHALMREEERTRGSVGFDVWKAFFKAGNGSITLPIIIGMLVLTQVATVVGNYSLVWFQRDTLGLSTGGYLGLYAGLGIAQGFFVFLTAAAAAFMGVYVSTHVHRDAAGAVMHAPVSFFDTTPLGRIQNRFGKDIDTLDNTFNDSVRMALNTLGSVVGSIVLIAVVDQYFLIAVAVLLFGYYKFSRFYRASARELKRLDNILRSSLYAHFAESLTGLASIRAYGESQRFIDTNEELIDVENRAYYLTVVNQRWLGMRLDICGAFLVFSVAAISVAQARNLNPSQIGLVLSYIISVQSAFSWLIRQTAEVENDISSFERINYYSEHLEQEAPSEIEATKPEPDWPSRGEIKLEGVQLAYRPGLPLVLKGLDLHIHAGESLGIVGRTGAGKSSIMVALFRLVELSGGRILIDDVDISKLGLADLRRKLAIIPQDALLFNGTLRSNLDPFSVHTDAELWDALRRAYLVEKPALPAVKEGEELPPTTATQTSRFQLDMKIEDSGENLSVGERSLVSLARALVRNAQINLLDEATASVDYETDARIQSTIASEFGGKTLLTIAHRLVTIISYDRVLVMDHGEVAELDTPVNLFNARGIFYELCSRSNIGLQDIIQASAARKRGVAPPPELLRRATSQSSSQRETIAL